MNKQAKSKKRENYLELAKVDQTFLIYEKQKYSVEAVPPDVFDKWIRQFVETIINVDTFLWDIFDKWQIINAVLEGQFLTMKDQGDGTFLLQSKHESEEKASEAPEQSEEKASELSV